MFDFFVCPFLNLKSMIFFPNISKFFTASKIPTTRIFFPEWKEEKNNWRENIKRQKERKAQQQIRKKEKKQKEILKRTVFSFHLLCVKTTPLRREHSEYTVELVAEDQSLYLLRALHSLSVAFRNLFEPLSLSLSKTFSLLILNLNSFNSLAFVLIFLPLSTRFHKFVSVKSKSFSYYLRLLLGFGSNGKYQLNVHFLSLRESWRPINFLETPPFSVLLLLLVLPFFHLFFLFYYFIDFCLDLFSAEISFLELFLY